MKERQAVRQEIEDELRQLAHDRWWIGEVQRLARGRALVSFHMDSQCRGGIARGLTPAEFLDEVLMDKWHDEELAIYDALAEDDVIDLLDAYEEADRWDRWDRDIYETDWWDDVPMRNDFEYGSMVYSSEHGSPA